MLRKGLLVVSLQVYIHGYEKEAHPNQDKPFYLEQVLYIMNKVLTTPKWRECKTVL